MASTIASHAEAHHEAVLGPQSATAIDGSAFVAVQLFTKRSDSSAAPQETSLLVSGGIKPVVGLPLSLSITLPMSMSSGERTRVGLENVILSGRWRFELESLQRTFGKEDNFILLISGLELPTGSMDQAFGRAPMNFLWGLMSSVEWSTWSAMGFALTRIEGENGEGIRKGHELLSGAGLALTPLETERLMISGQFGVSYEVGLATHSPDETTSGDYQRIMVTPATVIGIGRRVQLLGYGAIPASQHVSRAEDRNLWRAGLGVAYFLD
ncbi:MAG: hypothetical protein QM784_17865 [Polyangiaceae bacterium]